MNDWQEKAELFKERLKELDEWVADNWLELPVGVKKIICRGEASYRENIKQFEKWAKEDSKAE